MLTVPDADRPCAATSVFSVNNGHFCEPAPGNHDFMRRTKIPAHGILDSHISEAKTITTRLRLNVLRPVLGVAYV